MRISMVSAKNPYPIEPATYMATVIGRFFSLLILLVIAFVFFNNYFIYALALFGSHFVIRLWILREYLNTFSFRIDPEYVVVDRGVIGRQRSSFPYTKIQDVNLYQGFVQSYFGLWNVSISTATTTSEISSMIPGLSYASAEKIRDQILDRVKVAQKRGK